MQLDEDENEIFKVQQDVPGRRNRPNRGPVEAIVAKGGASWIRNIFLFNKVPRHTLMVHHMDNPLLHVDRGTPMSTVCVGGVQRYVACAQLPPEEGDKFTHGPFWLQAGDYSLLVRGGVNQHHGSLKLSIDGMTMVDTGVEVGDESAKPQEVCQNWSCPDTYFMVEQVAHSVHVHTTGPHYLTGEVVSHRDGETLAYWMCLSELELRKNDERPDCAQPPTPAFNPRQVLPEY